MIRLSTAFTAAALLALPAASASAQGAMPTPGCYGIQVTDKAGDSLNGTDQMSAGSPSSDLIGGWIEYDAAKNTGTANIQVENLTEGEIDPPYTGITWTYYFSTAAGARQIRAFQDRTGIVKYTWGEPRAITDDQTAPRVTGDTTGTLFPGKSGVIQIVLPLDDADFGAKPGTQLKSQSLETRQSGGGTPAAAPSTGLPIFTVAPIYDTAAGKGAFTFGPCPGAGTAPGSPGGPPAPAPATPNTATSPAAGTAGPGSFDVKVTVPKLSAKKLKKAKKFTIKLTGNATGIKAAVRKKLNAGKNLATGKLATLKGKGKLTLKGKKLKKGTYVLVFSGKNAQGQPAEGAVTIKIKK
jgi:hypothetical protein